MFWKTMIRNSAVIAALATAGVLFSFTSVADDSSDQPAEKQNEPYKLSVQVPDKVKVGEDAKLIVTIEAQPGFKINKGYPAKLKLAEAEGVTFEKTVLRKGDAELKDHGKTPVFSVGYKMSKAATTEMKGKLKFSVCSSARCLMKREKISASLKAE